DSAASVGCSPGAAPDVAFPLSGPGRHAEVVISELNGWPACSPVNASPTTLRPSAHDSGPRWIATPFLCGSCIRYSKPVYPGAYPDPFVFLNGMTLVPRNSRPRLPTGARSQAVVGHDYGVYSN